MFANVYMNELDQFMKHELKVKRYARYTDDFVIIAEDRGYLEQLLPLIQSFLRKRLEFKLHPQKVTIHKHRQGADFLGYVVLPHYIVVRKRTEKRIFRKLKERVFLYRRGIIKEEALFGSLHSYLGVLSHANAYHLRERLLNTFWFWLKE